MYPDDLDPEDYPHYDNIAAGGLLRKVTPPDIEAKFMKQGYIQRAVGGLVLTKSCKEKFMGKK